MFREYVFLAVMLMMAAWPAASAEPIPVYGYKIINIFPHDRNAFTQGLFYRQGYLYESTGRYGQSSLRQVELETGRVLKMRRLPHTVFAEGIVDWKDKIIGLTWRAERGFVWQLESFDEVDRFTYEGQGWGLTRSDRELFQSNGSSQLRVLDPETHKILRVVEVSADGRPVTQLNELEWVEGEIFANIWQTDRIARIDPETGRVVGWIDLSGLLYAPGGGVDVLNGIAYDPRGRLFVTGKLWPKLYEIQLIRQKKSP